VEKFVDKKSALFRLSFAFALRTFAAAFDALVAMAFLFSGVILAYLAFLASQPTPDTALHVPAPTESLLATDKIGLHLGSSETSLPC